MGQRPGAADPLLREETCHCHQPASQMFRRLSVMFKMHPCEGWIDLRATIIFFITHGALHGLPCFTVVSQFPFHKSLTNGRVYQISGLCEHFFFAYEPLACGNVFAVALFCHGAVASKVKTGQINHRGKRGNLFYVKDVQVAANVPRKIWSWSGSTWPAAAEAAPVSQPSASGHWPWAMVLVEGQGLGWLPSKAAAEETLRFWSFWSLERVAKTCHVAVSKPKTKLRDCCSRLQRRDHGGLRWKAAWGFWGLQRVAKTCHMAVSKT